MSTQQKTKKGFTIIEVVLVLAIAGLIFMMVFLALPALQRSQRDTQRRDDMARFQAQIANYQTNNRGQVPNNTAATKGVWIPTVQKAKDAATMVTATEAKISGVATKVTSTNAAGTWGAFLDNYMWAANDTFTDPGGTAYAVGDHGKITKDSTAQQKSLSLSQMDFIIHVYHGAICGATEGTVDVSTSGSTRKLAILYKLEGAGYYCGEV